MEREIQFPEGFEERVKEAFKKSAEAGPERLALCVGPRVLTAGELAKEVEEETPLGRRQIESARRFLEKHPSIGVEGILRMIAGEPDVNEERRW